MNPVALALILSGFAFSFGLSLVLGAIFSAGGASAEGPDDREPDENNVVSLRGPA